MFCSLVTLFNNVSLPTRSGQVLPELIYTSNDDMSYNQCVLLPCWFGWKFWLQTKPRFRHIVSDKSQIWKFTGPSDKTRKYIEPGSKLRMSPDAFSPKRIPRIQCKWYCFGGESGKRASRRSCQFWEFLIPWARFYLNGCHGDVSSIWFSEIPAYGTRFCCFTYYVGTLM